MSNKKYSVIYADPPWKLTAGRKLADYQTKNGKQIPFIDHEEGNKSRELAYPSMTVEEICNMPVRGIIEKDAHLYIWVTNSHLPHVFDVIKAWGFKYSTTLVWAKTTFGGGLGGAYRISTEYLIFARRGNLKTKKTIRQTWFQVKRQYKNGYPQHSSKPQFFMELIEKVSPGPYIELFAREETEGWDVFGNQVENSIVLI